MCVEKLCQLTHNIYLCLIKTPPLYKRNLMKYGVKKETLLIIAGLVWIIAGANVLRIGIVTWFGTSEELLFRICEATIVFLFFFILIFKKLYYKHTLRIEQKHDNKHCPFSFFDLKSWLIMAFMITLGISIRAFHLLPNSFISFFYTGLSIALIVTGTLFIRYWWLKQKNF